MQDDLKKFIQENRSAFKELEPSANHASRFEKKLASDSKSNPFRMLWLAAAVIVLFLGIGAVLKLINQAPVEVQSAGMSLSEISPELGEIERFLSEEIKQTTAMVQSVNGSSVDLASINKHLESLETEYVYLKLELAKNQGDQRIIERMIQNYKTRLLLLEKHLKMTKSQHQPLKPISNENA